MYKILICDDERDIRNALRIYLTGEGYAVCEADSGLAALELMQREEVQLVLMDIMMPGMDGMTATAKLREQSNVPVILITAKSEPVFGCVYKLVAVEDKDGNIVPKIKISENVGKITTPHFKKLYRFYGRDTGKAIADYLCVYDETVDDSDKMTIFDPEATWKRKEVYHFEARELLVPIFKNGELVYKQPSLEEIRAYCAAQVDTLWDEVKRFDNPHRYYVDLSQKLYDIKQELLTKNGSH